MLSCQEKPEVRDPLPKGPPGLNPVPGDEGGCAGDDGPAFDPPPQEEAPLPDKPEVRDPLPTGPRG